MVKASLVAQFHDGVVAEHIRHEIPKAHLPQRNPVAILVLELRILPNILVVLFLKPVEPSLEWSSPIRLMRRHSQHERFPPSFPTASEGASTRLLADHVFRSLRCIMRQRPIMLAVEHVLPIRHQTAKYAHKGKLQEIKGSFLITLLA